MAKMTKPPTKLPTDNSVFVFLAGSIEMGAAEDWQQKLFKKFESFAKVHFLNPRREEWDSSWVQSIENKNFYDQVKWEHSGLLKCDIAVFNFEPETKSPISLLELGMISILKMTKGSPFVIVRCPKKFWRFGNVEFMCDEHDIPLVETLEELEKELKDILTYDFDIETEKEK